jgi:hypothetical protein
MKSAFLWLTLLGSASAVELPCGPADEGAVTLDGLTDDWSDVQGVDSPENAFTVKCNTVGKNLALLFDVRDKYFVRTPKGGPGEDHLELSLGGKRLTVFPGDADKIKDKVVPEKGVKVASALQPNGWAVEMMLPLSSVPGWKPGLPAIALEARFLDSNSKAARKTDRQVEVSGHIVFAEADAALDAFLKDRNLSRADVFWDKSMTLGKKSGARVLMAGRYLAVVSDGFLFLELPFSSQKDLREVKLVDLAGDGREAVVMRYVERGGSGSREVLAVFRPLGDAQIARVFACEVGKAAGPRRIDDKVSFVKRGRATDIVVEAGAAAGFDKASYQEAPAQDMIPILLPWDDDKKARYQFSGDEYQRGQ